MGIKSSSASGKTGLSSGVGWGAATTFLGSAFFGSVVSELLEAGKGGLCVSVVNGEIKGLDIIETLSQKRKTDFGIYEDAMKLR